MADLTDSAAKNLKPFGFDSVQIDDGWQRGDSQGNGPYPSGMKKTADDIKAHGLTPGIWFMPFAGTDHDPWFADHPDWFVKRADGTPYTTQWGGTSLDLTDTEARAYMRSFVSSIARNWGYTYFKMDGLYTGVAAKQVCINSGYKEDDLGDAVFLDPNKTNTEVIRDGLKLVRQAAGPDVFFLGCTVAQNMRSRTGATGLVDSKRIGADNWTSAFVPPFRDHLRVPPPAHGCEVLSVRPLMDRPILLSASRHKAAPCAGVPPSDKYSISVRVMGAIR